MPKKKRRSKKSREKPPLRERLADRFAEHDSAVKAGAVAALLLGSATVAWGVVTGTRALERRAGDLLAGEPVIEIVWPTIGSPPPGERAESPTWLAGQFRDELMTIAQDAADDEPGVFNAAQLRAIGEDLFATGWFAERPLVVRAPGGSIRVEGEWRPPAVSVRAGDIDYLISWDKRRLPVQYPVGESGQRVIVGAAYAPPVQNGRPDFATEWMGRDVEAALLLIKTLRADPEVFAEVAAVDVGAYGADGSLVIITRRGSRVVWGGRPDEFHPGEITTPEKMTRLRELLERYGSIDAGHNELEIAWERELVID